MPASANNAEVLKALDVIQDEIADIKRCLVGINDAFPQNDLKKPDYDGHRQDHVNRMEEAKMVREYKRGVAKSVLVMFAVFLFGLLSSGFWQFAATKIAATQPQATK